MLVICEDCAKKYNIDESKIRGNRARFTCNECGHIIIVNKSDLSRPLVHAAEPDYSTPSSTIDLLKEMEAPLTLEPDSSQETSTSDQSIQQQAEASTKDTKKKKIAWKSLPITAYVLLGGLISFVLTNAAVMYILSQYSWVIAQHFQEFQKDILITSVLVLLVAWALSFIILFAIGTYMSKSLLKLTKPLNLLNLGDKEATVAVQQSGPEEVVNLSRILSELCRRVK